MDPILQLKKEIDKLADAVTTAAVVITIGLGAIAVAIIIG